MSWRQDPREVGGLEPEPAMRIHKDSPHLWVQRSTVLGVSALREKNKRHWQPRRERGAQSRLLGCPQQNNLKGRRGPSAPDETELEEVQRVLPGNQSAGMATERQKGTPRLLLSLRWILGPGDGLKSEERAPGPLWPTAGQSSPPGAPPGLKLCQLQPTPRLRSGLF